MVRFFQASWRFEVSECIVVYSMWTVCVIIDILEAWYNLAVPKNGFKHLSILLSSCPEQFTELLSIMFYVVGQSIRIPYRGCRAWPCSVNGESGICISLWKSRASECSCSQGIVWEACDAWLSTWTTGNCLRCFHSVSDKVLPYIIRKILQWINVYDLMYYIFSAAYLQWLWVFSF